MLWRRHQVPSSAGSSTLRSDAAVNAANVLCSLAELCGGQEGVALLTQAVQLYQSALAQEEDAAVSDPGGVAATAGLAPGYALIPVHSWPVCGTVTMQKTLPSNHCLMLPAADPQQPS